MTVFAALGGLALWWFLHDQEPPVEPRGQHTDPSAPRAERTRPLAPSAPPRLPAAPAPRPLDYADDGVPIMPPGPNDPRPDGPVHPHPITPQHLRIFRENDLLGQLNGAMDVKDATGIRRLLKTYREEYPEDPQQMQSGYELIANCLDHPGDATRATAQKYFDEERASTLRRFVLRYCLAPQN